MEWMYGANSKGVNSEEYLLGKKIDSAVLDSQNDEEQESSSGAAAVDMANKIREDPLFAIKQKEASKRKALLENPIRLKQLQQMLQTQVGEKSKKSKKDKKSRKEKKRKKSRHRHKSSSSSSSGEESEGDLDAKLMERLRGKSIKEEEMKAVLKGGSKPYGLIGGRSSSRSDGEQGEREGHSKRRGREGDGRGSEDERREDRRDRRSDRRDRSGERRRRSRSPRRERKRPSEMNEEELERRRQEMLDNAKWRDDQRKTRIKQYKVEDAKVDEIERKKPKKQDFFNPLKVVSQSSVEDRIKRNIHNIQRTKADLDKNFAKR